MTQWRSMLLWGGLLAAMFPVANASAQGTGASTYLFREPTLHTYSLVSTPNGAGRRAQGTPWLEARMDSSTNAVHLGSRIAIQLADGVSLADLIAGRPLTTARRVTSSISILQCADAFVAASEAAALAQQSGVIACHPVMRRPHQINGPYAPQPNDQYYGEQWYLESRASDGARNGADLNVRGAWPWSRGAGVTIAIVDSGVELDHPDLNSATVPDLQWDFTSGTTNALPAGRFGEFAAHGTAVGGLALARGYHSIGMIGVAPEAGLASWRIFASVGTIADQEQLMDMFQAHSNVVAVQNHSWGSDLLSLDGPSMIEEAAIANAVKFGRDGKGVVMVRAAGNARVRNANANDDAYVSDPRGIAVAVVARSGRATSYSEPGACLLVAAPVQDNNGSGIFSTDLLGTDGVNQLNFFTPNENLNDYRFASLGFTGTSAAAPQVAGIAALILSANPALGHRDVQQILALSSRHLDMADPDVKPNGAGLLVSHNVGFGIPDAGEAVRLARTWTPRPAMTTLRITNSVVAPISDEGTVLLVHADTLPAPLSIAAAPGNGPQPPTPFPSLPLVHVGTADAPIAMDLTGKGALIQRSSESFSNKVGMAEAAGAAYAIIYNNATGTPANPGGDALVSMIGLDYSAIPAVFIGQADGESLAALVSAEASTVATMGVKRTLHFMNFPENLLVEHVSLKVTTDHPQRGDLRITLTSPQGMTSVLQNYNLDSSPGPNGWEYHSTLHLGEASAGTWFVSISDAFPGGAGFVQQLVLTVRGVRLTDSDHDGLDDVWEQMHFGNLFQGAKDDPDGDGFSNAREQLMGTSPATSDIAFRADLSTLRAGLVRLSWPAALNTTFNVYASTEAGQPLTLLTNIAGQFPETEFIISQSDFTQRFFRVERVPAP